MGGLPLTETYQLNLQACFSINCHLSTCLILYRASYSWDGGKQFVLGRFGGGGGSKGAIATTTFFHPGNKIDIERFMQI